MSCCLSKNRRGFSFMELMVVIAIIMIMTVVMLVISVQDRERKKYQAAGREVTAVVRETQNNALTGKQFITNELPCAMMFRSNGSVFEMRGSFRTLNTSCGNDVDFTGTYTRQIMEEDLSQRNLKINVFNVTKDGTIQQANGGGMAHIVFTVPYGKYIDDLGVETWAGVNLNSMSQGAIIEIVDRNETNITSPAMAYRICVHSTGLMEEVGLVTQEDAGDDLKKCNFGFGGTP